VISENWKVQLQNWANQYAGELANKPGIHGVVIGGSIARGQEWHHSDLLEMFDEMPLVSVLMFQKDALPMYPEGMVDGWLKQVHRMEA